MADGDRQGGMRGNIEDILSQITPVEQNRSDGGTSLKTKEDLIRDAIIADQLRNVYKGGGRSGGPLSSLLSQGQKVPAEMFTRNWPVGRQNPLSWLIERFTGSNTPGARLGQWMDSGKFTNTPWRLTKTLDDIPYDDLKKTVGGSVPREFKSGRQIGRDVHSILSAKLNQILGEPRAGEAWNSSARMSAAKKLGFRSLLKGIPVAGAIGSAVHDTYKYATEPDYSTGEYGKDLAENASWLGGVTTGVLGSTTRFVGEEAADALKEGTSAFRNMSELGKLKWILGQHYP